VRVSKPEPPKWGEDHLSGFIRLAYENSWATFVGQPFFQHLIKIDAAFEKAIDTLHNSPKVLPNFFLLRAHSSFRAGARLSTSTQVYESYPVLRACLESGVYGLHVDENPGDAKVWLDRDETDDALKAMKKAFLIGPLLEELKETDAGLYEVVRILYERTIDLGAHPNPLGMLAMAEMTKDEKGVNYGAVYLTNNPTLVAGSLKTTAQVGIAVLRLFRHVHTERFDLIGLSDDIKHLSAGL
jgi:hypothetical protein